MVWTTFRNLPVSVITLIILLLLFDNSKSEISAVNEEDDTKDASVINAVQDNPKFSKTDKVEDSHLENPAKFSSDSKYTSVEDTLELNGLEMCSKASIKALHESVKTLMKDQSKVISPTDFGCAILNLLERESTFSSKINSLENELEKLRANPSVHPVINPEDGEKTQRIWEKLEVLETRVVMVEHEMKELENAINQKLEKLRNVMNKSSEMEKIDAKILDEVQVELSEIKSTLKSMEGVHTMLEGEINNFNISKSKLSELESQVKEINKILPNLEKSLEKKDIIGPDSEPNNGLNIESLDRIRQQISTIEERLEESITGDMLSPIATQVYDLLNTMESIKKEYSQDRDSVLLSLGAQNDYYKNLSTEIMKSVDTLATDIYEIRDSLTVHNPIIQGVKLDVENLRTAFLNHSKEHSQREIQNEIHAVLKDSDALTQIIKDKLLSINTGSVDDKSSSGVDLKTQILEIFKDTSLMHEIWEDSLDSMLDFSSSKDKELESAVKTIRSQLETLKTTAEETKVIAEETASRGSKLEVEMVSKFSNFSQRFSLLQNFMMTESVRTQNQTEIISSMQQSIKRLYDDVHMNFMKLKHYQNISAEWAEFQKNVEMNIDKAAETVEGMLKKPMEMVETVNNALEKEVVRASENEKELETKFGDLFEINRAYGSKLELINRKFDNMETAIRHNLQEIQKVDDEVRAKIERELESLSNRITQGPDSLQHKVTENSGKIENLRRDMDKNTVRIESTEQFLKSQFLKNPDQERLSLQKDTSNLVNDLETMKLQLDEERLKFESLESSLDKVSKQIMEIEHDLKQEVQNIQNNEKRLTKTVSDTSNTQNTLKSLFELQLSLSSELQKNFDEFTKNVLTMEEELTASLRVESMRAKSAESQMSSIIMSEVDRAKKAESELMSSLGSLGGQLAQLASAIHQLDLNLTSEISRAQTAEIGLLGNINEELSRASEREEVVHEIAVANEKHLKSLESQAKRLDFSEERISKKLIEISHELELMQSLKKMVEKTEEELTSVNNKVLEVEKHLQVAEKEGDMLLSNFTTHLINMAAELDNRLQDVKADVQMKIDAVNNEIKRRCKNPNKATSTTMLDRVLSLFGNRVRNKESRQQLKSFMESLDSEGRDDKDDDNFWMTGISGRDRPMVQRSNSKVAVYGSMESAKS